MTITKSKTSTKTHRKTSPRREPIVIEDKQQIDNVLSGTFQSESKVFLIFAALVWVGASVLAGILQPVLFLVPMLGIPAVMFASYYIMAFWGKQQRHRKGISPTLVQCIYEHRRINGVLNPIKLIKQYWNGEEILSKDFYDVEQPKKK